MYTWTKQYSVKHNSNFITPVGDHPTFKDGELLHIEATACGTYTIVRQDTCKVYLLFRGQLSDAVLQRKALSADALKNSI